MSSRLVALTVDAEDPARLALFWGGLLGRRTVDDARGGIALPPPDDTGFAIRFVPTVEPKSVPNPMHPDLTSASLEEQQRTVARAVELGGRHVDVGQRPDELHVVLADPEGNEFCVIEPGNAFLAGCGFIGALASDGRREVGLFWRRVLGWPLVWDQDQETAIRSPHGGPTISWGGYPARHRAPKNRLHLDLAPEGDQQAEVDRLLALGATHVDIGQGDVPWLVLADPDGNELCVLERA